MAEPFFTIGHSTRTWEEFLDALRAAEVTEVVDVRRTPGSRRYPHFDAEPLAHALAEEGIGYRRVEALTGRRPVSHDVDFAVNAWWQNRSFHNYADHALSAEFSTALDELRAAGQQRRLTVMCSEAVWWRCHRRLIADHLLARGEDVRHIVDAAHIDAAQLSAGAVVDADGQVTYPAASST